MLHEQNGQLNLIFARKLTCTKSNSCSFCNRVILVGDFQMSTRVSNTILLLCSQPGTNFTSVFIRARPRKYPSEVAAGHEVDKLGTSAGGTAMPSSPPTAAGDDWELEPTATSHFGINSGKAFASIFWGDFASSSLKGWPASDRIMYINLKCRIQCSSLATSKEYRDSSCTLQFILI